MTKVLSGGHTLKRSICQAKGCKYFAMHYTRVPFQSLDLNALFHQILLCSYHFRLYANMNLPEREKFETQPPKKKWL